MHPENFSYHIRQSTGSPKEAVLMGVEVAPPSVIEEVVINKEAHDLLPRPLQYIASAEYLIPRLLMSVPANKANQHIISPFSYGRTVPIEFKEFPFGDKLGRVLTGKGSWVGGNWLHWFE